MSPKSNISIVVAAGSRDTADLAARHLAMQGATLSAWSPDEDPRDLVGADLVLAAVEDARGIIDVLRAHTGVPVILFGEHADAATLDLAVELGCFDVLGTATDLDRLEFVVQRALNLGAITAPAVRSIASAADADRCDVITVVGPKGGVGATTIATSIATRAASIERDTLLIDLDLHGGDAALQLGVPSSRTLLDVVLSQGDLDRHKLRGFATQLDSGLHVVAAPTRPQDAVLVSPDRILDLLGVAREGFGTVVIDTPAWSGDPLLAALEVTDTLVVVASPDIAAIKAVRQLIDYLDELEFPAHRRKIALNRSTGAPGMGRSEIEATLGAKVMASIPTDKVARTCANRGVPVMTTMPRAASSRALRGLADDLLDAGSGARRTLRLPRLSRSGHATKAAV